MQNAEGRIQKSGNNRFVKSIEESVVKALDGSDIGIFPFLDYINQDQWEIGTTVEIVLELIKKHIPDGSFTDVLDLGCGKGAVAVGIAQQTSRRVKGIDVMPEFIDYARAKAREFSVQHLCEFVLEDIRLSVERENEHDMVIHGACGDILGDFPTMLRKLNRVIKHHGFLVIDDAFSDDSKPREGSLSHSQVKKHFTLAGFDIVEEAINTEHADMKRAHEHEKECTAKRIGELSLLHPDKQKLFKAYLDGQIAEYKVLEDEVICATWLLRKLQK